jgi:diguanylate cyclase (GGDEF)-like protein
LALYLAPELHGTLFAPQAVPVGGPTIIAVTPPVEPEPEAASSTATLQAEPPAAEPVAPAPIAAAPVAPAPATAPQLAQTEEPVGELIDQFKGDLLNYRNELADVENRMRNQPETPDVTAMQTCLADLFAANARYLAQQEDSGVRLQRHCESVEQHKPAGQQLGTALDQQAQQVLGANQNLEQLDPQDNTPQGCQRIFDETTRLIDASNSLRETLDDVEQQLTGQESVESTQVAAETDPLSKLIPLSRLEAALAECWEADPSRSQPLSLGLVDLDDCGALNETRGRTTGDRVLATIARVVSGSLQTRQLASRLNGEKFLLLLPGRNGRESTGTLELIRQQVETTRFQAGADQFGSSVSCAVVETVAGDVMDTVLARLETTLQEAKRCGRNRTFFHDGKFPTPVVPPILSLQLRTQQI